jgi:hypothetical protein
MSFGSLDNEMAEYEIIQFLVHIPCFAPLDDDSRWWVVEDEITFSF